MPLQKIYLWCSQKNKPLAQSQLEIIKSAFPPLCFNLQSLILQSPPVETLTELKLFFWPKDTLFPKMFIRTHHKYCQASVEEHKVVYVLSRHWSFERQANQIKVISLAVSICHLRSPTNITYFTMKQIQKYIFCVPKPS